MRTIDKVLMKLFQKFPGLDGVQGLKLALTGAALALDASCCACYNEKVDMRYVGVAPIDMYL